MYRQRQVHRRPRPVPRRETASAPPILGSRRRSALNLYGHQPDAFHDSAQLTAGLFGVQAAMLLYGADHASDLGRALASRDVIGQAKGILMERFTVDDSEAFQMLVSSSQETNMKLVSVAHWLADEANSRRADDRRPAT